jgi:transcription initiation factor TFIIIB Brf1 subunit/transcription initiation factor TFIIB
LIFECPGSKIFKQPQPENIVCPNCKREIEIWTDESRVKCACCGNIATRKIGQSCIEWCKYAKYCVGDRPEIKNRDGSGLSSKSVP